MDLIGLLPTPEQLDGFLSDQSSGNSPSVSSSKRTALVDSLLANDRAYAEHWLTFWNDLLRNDYSGTGYIDGGRKQVTGWLYRALLENKHYDQFVRELIAPKAESEGFIRGIKWRGNVNASQVVELQFAQNVGQVFLGVNLKCASCHDSFIDDWKLKDSYGLAAVTAEQPLKLHRCDVPTGETASAAFIFPELGAIDAAQPRDKRLEQLAQLMTDRRNGRLARTLVNRLWHRLMGRGIVHPVDSMDGEPWSAEVLDYLAAELIDSDYDVKQVLRLIATSRIYQARCAEPTDDQSEPDWVFRGPVARRMTAEQLLDALWRVTGTAPKKAAADFGKREGEPVRASLVNADLLMRSLGRPNREQVVTTRPDDLSTLQALELTNGPLLSDLIAQGAKKLHERNAPQSTDSTVTGLYKAMLCRLPNADELTTARQIAGEPVTEVGLADLLWCMLMLPEFQVIK